VVVVVGVGVGVVGVGVVVVGVGVVGVGVVGVVGVGVVLQPHLHRPPLQQLLAEVVEQSPHPSGVLSVSVVAASLWRGVQRDLPAARLHRDRDCEAAPPRRRRCGLVVSAPRCRHQPLV
jgi:hypothetical protein